MWAKFVCNKFLIKYCQTLKFFLHAADNINVRKQEVDKMSVNLYGNIGTTYSGIVTGAELERVSKEIFGGAQVKSTEKSSQINQQQNQQTQQSAQLGLYDRKTDINLTQQVAQARTDFNVQLSPQALQNIEALRTLAATQQNNVHKLSEGKIYVPVDNSPKSDVETVFAVSHPTSVLNAFAMDKDKKGSNAFSYTQLPSQSKEESANSSTGAIDTVA